MPTYKLTNVKLKPGKTMLEAVRALKEIGYEGVTTELFNKFKDIQKYGAILEREYMLKSVIPVFDFDLEERKSDFEIYEELEEQKLSIARKWYDGLTTQEQEYVDILLQQYIVR